LSQVGVAGRADLHARLVPGAADGPDSLETALQRIREAYADGVRVLYAVSAALGRDSLRAAETGLRREMERAGLALEIHVGHVVALAPDLADRFVAGDIMPVGPGRFVSVELPADGFPGYTLDALFQLSLEGARVLLVGPEKNAALSRHPELAERLRAMEIVGVALADSFRPSARPAIRAAALALIERGLIQAVASNGTVANRARTSDVVPLLARRFGEAVADQLVHQVPLAIHAGLPVDMRRHQGRWLSRLTRW
jgi:tyrosine-protein phosphatase YwqE